MSNVATYPDLSGASVFITGGGAGIGLSLTEGFLRQGAKVAFVGRSDYSAEVDRLEAETGRRPLFIRCDVTDVTALHAAMDAAEAAHGPLDVLVNNAANDMRFDPLEVSEADWDAQHDVNLKHYFFACQRAARSMIPRGKGAIINFSSITYIMGAGGMTPYTTANAAITGMTRALARDWGHHGIRVNALAPGMVLTQRQLRDWITPEAKAAVMDRQALKVEMGPDDMIGPALFLASAASGVVTGQCLVADAGVVGTG